MIEIKMNAPLENIISSCRIIDYKEQDIYEELVKLNEKILRKVFLTEKVKENLSTKEQEYLSNYHFNLEYMNQMTIYKEIKKEDKKEYKDTVSKYLEPLKIELYIAYYHLRRCIEKWAKLSKNSNPRIVRETRRVLNKYLKFTNNYSCYFRKIITQCVSYTRIRIDHINIFTIEEKSDELNQLLQPEVSKITKALVIDSSQQPGRFREIKKKDQAKIDFYINHPCERIIRGIPHTYNAYIYSNGLVILDSEYNNDAMFIMSIDTFLERLEKTNDSKRNFIFDKRTLNQSIPCGKDRKITRIIHSDNWQQQLGEIINEPIASEELEDKLDEVANKVKAYKKRKSS